MKTLMRNGRDRRSENPFLGHAKKERVSLFGTDQRITSGPAAKRPHSKAEYMTAPERFADSQIPLAPRAPSIHAAPGFNWGQAEARGDLQAGRPLLAAHSRSRGDCRVAARPGESREISLAHATPGAATLQGRGGGARQQDGAHGVGAAGPRRHISGA